MIWLLPYYFIFSNTPHEALTRRGVPISPNDVMHPGMYVAEPVEDVVQDSEDLEEYSE